MNKGRTSVISRRRFLAQSAASMAAMPIGSAKALLAEPITAAQVVDRVKTNIGIEWSADTVDGFKAGDPATTVTGIVTTSLASLDILAKAVKTGANMIITSEPTFFAKTDSTTPPVRRFPGAPAPAPNTPSLHDAVFSAKADFIREHNLVVWRFSEHWRRYKTDPFTKGLAGALGWTKPATTLDNATAGRFTIPATSLDALASYVKKTLNARGGMRVIGNPALPIKAVALLPGTSAIQASIAALPSVDVIVAGEVREWETVEYVRDTVDLGGKKSLILVGRILSEGPGMQLCASWLKSIVPEVPATSILTADPYWRPNA